MCVGVQSVRKKQLEAAAVVILILFVFCFWTEIYSIILVFACAVVFAGILSPICNRLEKYGVNPQGAAGISVFLFALLILSVVTVFFPYMAVQIFTFVKNNAAIMKQATEMMNIWIAHIGLDALQWSHLMEGFIERTSGAVSGIARAGLTLATDIGKYAFSAIMAYYLLSERRRIYRHVILFIPFPYRKAVLSTLLGCINAAMGYLSGMVKTSIFVFFTTYMGLVLIRVPNAFFLSLLMALFEVFPYIGPILAAVPILLSAASLGIQKVIYALIVVIAVQLIEGNFVGPHFAASSTAIRPFAALAGIFVFGTFFGFWGIVLAVPVLTVIQCLIWSVFQARSSLQS